MKMHKHLTPPRCGHINRTWELWEFSIEIDGLRYRSEYIVKPTKRQLRKITRQFRILHEVMLTWGNYA